jgi:hypothetical protein
LHSRSSFAPPFALYIPDAEQPGAVVAAILGFIAGLGYEEAKQRKAQRG